MARLELLERSLRERIVDEALAILEDPGAKVGSAAGRRLLAEAGARVDESSGVACIPARIIRTALETVPREFHLHDHEGRPRVRYGGDAVHFDPGSSAVRILDPQTGEHRKGETDDFIRLLKVAEMLPEYDAQSTALVCSDVPSKISDLYRLYLALTHSSKPIVTGAFTLEGLPIMCDMLAAATTGDGARAIFDVCPSPPLNWSEFATGSLITLARAGMPAEIVSMPLAGATAPATLAGSVVQHAAECLSGITIHQLASPGAPIVWGGAPAIFDMRFGTTPMGAMETAMIDAAYAEVGKMLGLPTHTYLCASDSKTLDTQAGMESGMTALVGALAGINMISGAGMLDFLASQSIEKLVIDAEAIAMVRRLMSGVEAREETLATHVFAELGHSAGFLQMKHTSKWFKVEQHMPSAVIDRGSLRNWIESGSHPTADRARARAEELLKQYERPKLSPEIEGEIRRIMERAAQGAGMKALPVPA
jgi:trimethylamine--corrinoid protein Co-methyltransferase